MRQSRILRIIQPTTALTSQSRSDNADRGLNNSEYPAKAEFNNSFIIHSSRQIGDANSNKKEIVFNFFKKIATLLKFMRDAAEKIRGHHMDMTNATFICQGQNLSLTNKCPFVKFKI